MSRELVFSRDVDLPAEAMYKAWTDPALLLQWFTPEPWKTVEAVLDVRPGGDFLTKMQSPEGTITAHPGIWLEVVPGRRLVFTNVFTKAWEPMPEEPEGECSFMMLAIVTFEPLEPGEPGEPNAPSRTRYTATVRHWREEDARKHEEMGFREGWGLALDQMVTLMKSN